MTEEILKPCPFCGSTNIDWFASFSDPTTNENIINVECINCGAQGASRRGEKNAIAAWNRRGYDVTADDTVATTDKMLAIITQLTQVNTLPAFRELKEAAQKVLSQQQ